ncbi:MAG: lysozyme inhibitor LprI family protein [Halobacteriota archaeon]
MGKHVILVFALPVLFQSISWADSSPLCSARSTQVELNACAEAELVKADNALNDAYQSLVTSAADDPLFVKNIRSAQKAWLAFRDAELGARFSCSEENVRQCWGSMYPMLWSARKAELTKQKTRELRQILKDGPGQ